MDARFRTLAQEAEAGRRPILTSEMFDPDTSKKLEAKFGFDRAAKVRMLQGWNLNAIATMPDGFTIYALLPDVGAPRSP